MEIQTSCRFNPRIWQLAFLKRRKCLWLPGFSLDSGHACLAHLHCSQAVNMEVTCPRRLQCSGLQLLSSKSLEEQHLSDILLNQVHIFLQSAVLQSPDPELPGGLWVGEGYSKPSDSLWTTLSVLEKHILFPTGIKTLSSCSHQHQQHRCRVRDTTRLSLLQLENIAEFL